MLKRRVGCALVAVSSACAASHSSAPTEARGTPQLQHSSTAHDAVQSSPPPDSGLLDAGAEPPRRSEGPAACPGDMKLVNGDYCTEVE
ncbi:MAG TPA: hypothetical protein VGJ84_15420, partial [Polyangiaceae bacterium]